MGIVLEERARNVQEQIAHGPDDAKRRKDEDEKNDCNDGPHRNVSIKHVIDILELRRIVPDERDCGDDDNAKKAVDDGVPLERDAPVCEPIEDSL